MPVIDFLDDMAQSDSFAFAILQGDMMDFLFKLYATGFRDPIGHADRFRGMFLRDACKKFLSTVLGKEAELRAIHDHPLLVVWPTGYLDSLPFMDGIHNREALRIQVWNSCKKPIVSWRLTSTFNSLLSGSISDTPAAYDTCVDVLELSA